MRVARSFILSSCLVAVVAAGGCAFDARGVSASDDSVGDDDGDDVPAVEPDAQLPPAGADAAVDPRSDAAPPPPPPPPTAAAVWLSTADGVHRLARQPDLPLGDPGQGQGGAIVVDTAEVGQVIDGFGAALTESSAWLLATRMSAAQRHELLVRLFDRDAGIGLRVLRLPLGASDFALSNYSYADQGPTLAGFSIAHDQQWILPVLHEIDGLAPDLHRIAAPWSPPGWMKTSGSMIGGTLEPGARGMLADYLVAALSAYAGAGLPIELLSIQNEPYYAPAGSPGMEMEPEEQAAILRYQLGPRLGAHGLGTRVMVWDHNWDDYAFATTVLADAGARQYAAGTAFHCYLGDVSAQDLVHAAHPELGVWLTECSSGTWQGDYGASLKDDARLVIEATRHWARAVLKWNLVLDETRGPQNHGCSDCTGTVEVRKADGAVTFNAEYYVLGHFGKFVGPGAVRIGSTSAGLAVEHVAFENQDGGIVVVALNPGAQAATFELRSTYGALTYVLPAGALVTFVIGGAASGPTQ